MVEKRQVRKEIFAKRKVMSQKSYEDYSEEIMHKVLEAEAFQNAASILTYVSFGREVDTKQLIRESLKAGKQVLVPKVTGSTMFFVEIKNLEELIPGTMGILEPVSDSESLVKEPSCMIMPGVAFDESRNRIGYGGGYYDKYLEQHKDLATIAVAFDYQILDQVPVQPTDISPQILITERRVLS